ncbi:hypothetical protein [Lacibacter sediminis]|uniref:Uncharacterized protein n=1 Tax=Lacibacter sediminis TaxID=2760713 RepID=A0A7G5XLI0_9BACT|nr:hypothetical protein [Lacibacter sediminis]QNA46333.1 hypothetical protein H4075_09230 [Lacibacter sediminis]
MEKRQTVSENTQDTANALKQKTNQDFNGKKPLPNDPDLKEKTPETEVPGIGDDKKKIPGEVIGENEKKGSTTEEHKPEPPSVDEPINPLPDEVIEGDSSAPTIINKQDDGKVF